MKASVTYEDPNGNGGVSTKNVPGGHVGVGNGLVVVDDAGTQVLAVPLDRLICIEFTKS